MVRRTWTVAVLMFFVDLAMNLFSEIFYRDPHKVLHAFVASMLLLVCGFVGLALYWWA